MGKYKFKLATKFTYHTGILPHDKFLGLWLRVGITGIVTIAEDYSWDGASPKVWALGRWIGTPDGSIDERTGLPRTYYATLVHDALYQFALPNGIYTRKEIDEIFLKMLVEADFKQAKLYYRAVRWFGGIYHKINLKIR